MKLTKWGAYIMRMKHCVYCSAKPGELCSGVEHNLSAWPHGIHYGRESGTSGTGESVRLHNTIPRTPLDSPHELDALVMAAVLRAAP